MNNLIAFASAVLGGGLLVFVQFLMTRHDQKKGLIASLIEKIDALQLMSEQRYAETLRRYIFAFSTECRRGIKHTKEEWDQVLADINEYEMTCRRIPEFVNGRCNIAIATLKEIYSNLLRRNDFAEEGQIYEE